MKPHKSRDKKAKESNLSEYNTPLHLFKFVDKYFDFKVDPCAMAGNNWLETKVCYTSEDNGLTQEWNGGPTFVNPPYGYGSEAKWLEKCYEQHTKYGQPIFILLPAKTEDIEWFPQAMTRCNIIIFLQRRLNFLKEGLIKSRNIMGSILFGLVDLNDIRFRKFRLEFLGQPKIETDSKCMYFPDLKKIELVLKNK